MGGYCNGHLDILTRGTRTSVPMNTVNIVVEGILVVLLNALQCKNQMNDNVDNNGNNEIIMIRASVIILIIRASLVIDFISRKEEKEATAGKKRKRPRINAKS